MRIKYLPLLFITFAIGCTMEPPAGQISDENNLSVPSFIYDAHVHYRAAPDWEAAFLEKYTQYNAMASVMVRMNDLESGIRFAKMNPDRVVPYAMVDIDSPTILEDILKVHQMGYKGLGELFATNDWNYDDPKYDPIWSLAEELGLIVAPHTGIHGSGKFSRMRPSFIATIAANHPDLTIIGLHFGNPWYSEASEVARRNNNVYWDMSGSSLIKKDDDPEFWKEFMWWTPHIGKRHVGDDRRPAWETIVFASDEPPDGFEDNIIRFNKVLNAAGIDDETRAKMYGLTLAKIHGISVDQGNEPAE